MDLRSAIANGAVPLQPLATNQCLLLLDRGGLQILGDGSVWLDNLYIRMVVTDFTHSSSFYLITTGQWDVPYRATVSTSAKSELFALTGPPRVFLTGLRLQGDGLFQVEDSTNGWEEHSTSGIGVTAPTYVSGACRQPSPLHQTLSCALT